MKDPIWQVDGKDFPKFVEQFSKNPKKPVKYIVTGCFLLDTFLPHNFVLIKTCSHLHEFRKYDVGLSGAFDDTDH